MVSRDVVLSSVYRVYSFEDTGCLVLRVRLIGFGGTGLQGTGTKLLTTQHNISYTSTLVLHKYNSFPWEIIRVSHMLHQRFSRLLSKLC